MGIELFIEGLSKNVFSETPVQLLVKETEYMELEEWTSLTAFTLISYINEEYGKRLLLPELIQAPTIEELYKIVNN